MDGDRRAVLPDAPVNDNRLWWKSRHYAVGTADDSGAWSCGAANCGLQYRASCGDAFFVVSW